MFKNDKWLKNFLYCTSKGNVGNDCRPAEFAKGAIEGAVAVLMAQGATFDKAWALVKAHLPETVSPHAIPKGWIPKKAS